MTYCGGRHDKCDTDIIVTIANVSMPVPGVGLDLKLRGSTFGLMQVVHHDYVDAPLAPQSEDWRLVSFPHPDYAFMMWLVEWLRPISKFALFIRLTKAKV